MTHAGQDPAFEAELEVDEIGSVKYPQDDEAWHGVAPCAGSDLANWS